MILRWLGETVLAARAFGALCVRHALLARLGHAGKNVTLGDGVRFYAPDRIRLGDGVILAHRVILRAMTGYPWTDPPQRFDPLIEIGGGCFLNNDTQISCVRRVTIGPETVIAERCFITDNNHSYENPDLSVRAQALSAPGEVRIGGGSWLGTHVVVAGNVRIGRHCVVGANSVVLDDLPDHCVAAGAPARVLKRFDPQTRAWVRAP